MRTIEELNMLVEKSGDYMAESLKYLEEGSIEKFELRMADAQSSLKEAITIAERDDRIKRRLTTNAVDTWKSVLKEREKWITAIKNRLSEF